MMEFLVVHTELNPSFSEHQRLTKLMRDTLPPDGIVLTEDDMRQLVKRLWPVLLREQRVHEANTLDLSVPFLLALCGGLCLGTAIMLGLAFMPSLR